MDRDNMTHGARTALNRDPEIREWCESWVKERERSNHPDKTVDEYDHHWKYHKPELMHAGATEAMQAWKLRDKE